MPKRKNYTWRSLEVLFHLMLCKHTMHEITGYLNGRAASRTHTHSHTFLWQLCVNVLLGYTHYDFTFLIHN